MQWIESQHISDNKHSIPNNWLHIHYYEALNILFRFENSLRIFVYLILKTNLGEKWEDASIGSGKSIKSETKVRINQAKSYGYLGEQASSRLLYLTSGELLEIIKNESYWKFFAQHFKTSKEIMEYKFHEIINVRNSLAHFRPINQNDIQLIKQNINQLFIGIEECLLQMYSQYNTAPTNCKEKYYSEISKIESSFSKISFEISNNEEWVKINFNYKIPVFHKQQYGTEHFSYKVGKLRIEKIFEQQKDIIKKAICFTEQNAWGNLNQEYDVVSEKTFSIIFKKNIVNDHIDEINYFYTEISKLIDQETSSLLQDHLARGDLVEASNAYATFNKNTDNPAWTVNFDQLNKSNDSITEDEYWGYRYHFASNITTNLHHFPWMRSSISSFTF